MTKENVTVVPDAVVDLAEWRASFESQATSRLYENVMRYAETRAASLARAGGTMDALDLVQSVLCDTYAGVLMWDPSSCSLEQHVRQSIKSRSRHERERARQVTCESLDAHDTATVASRLEGEADPATETVPRTYRHDVHGLASRLVDLAVAERDNDLLLVLRAMAGGAQGREQVIEDTGLDKTRYRNARKRLRKHLAKSLQPAVNPAQVASMLTALRGLPPEQLLDVAIARLRAALPAEAVPTPGRSIKLQLVPVPARKP